MAAISPGDVIRAHDWQASKLKRLICLDWGKQQFLRINSEPLWKPHVLIAADGADFLTHDSYVTLRQLVRIRAYDLLKVDHLGRLKGEHVETIVAGVKMAKTLTADQKDEILECLAKV